MKSPFAPRRPTLVGRDDSATDVAGGEGSESASPDLEVSRALQDLVGRFDAFVRRTAARHRLTGTDIDDVVQDLRLRIWKSCGTAEMIRRANASYIYRAAVSASLDIIRRRRAAKSSAARLDDVPPSALADRRVADDRLAATELTRAVHDALGLLAESRRGVVRMYLSGYDRFEIADLLGWTEGKTRNLLYRGLQELREILTSRGITRESL